MQTELLSGGFCVVQKVRNPDNQKAFSDLCHGHQEKERLLQVSLRGQWLCLKEGYEMGFGRRLDFGLCDLVAESSPNH